MSRPFCVWILSLSSLTLLGMGGCSRLPPPPQRVEVSPKEAGEAAIAQYDANNDGKLDATELAKCPPLQVAMQRTSDKIDLDGDGMLTADEIAERIQYWLDAATVVNTCDPRITLDGRLLVGATVTFEPEKFLGPGYSVSEGVSDEYGRAYIKGPDPMYPGLQLGFYRVRISKVVNGRETIPSRYNTETELGHEETEYVEGVGSLEFNLRSR